MQLHGVASQSLIYPMSSWDINSNLHKIIKKSLYGTSASFVSDVHTPNNRKIRHSPQNVSLTGTFCIISDVILV